MKVLVVDDSKAMRMIVTRALRQAGLPDLEVIDADNGRMAYDAILAAAPDLVLCDWNMPEMNGLELLEALNEAGVRVKFAFVTSESTAQIRAKARAAGALFLLSKPFTPQSLKERLLEHAL
jgi:two-component system chemotaxis response regulator CheY